MSKKSSDPGEALFEDGIIFLIGEITDKSVTEVIQKILFINRDKNCKEITLIINSLGGSTTAAFSLIDVMKLSCVDISTVGIGNICSSGLLIFMAGDDRRISANASILSHQFSWGNCGKYHELVGRRDEEDRANKLMLEHYKKCTGLPVKTIKEKLLKETDTWLTAQEAKKYNLTDTIITSF